MTKDDLSAERQALADAKSALVESAATELVSVGRVLFKDGEPGDPGLQRRYRLYKRLEAALALPAGPQRLEALYKALSEQIKPQLPFANPPTDTVLSRRRHDVSSSVRSCF